MVLRTWLGLKKPLKRRQERKREPSVVQANPPVLLRAPPLDRIAPADLQQLVGADAKLVLEIGAHDGGDTAMFLNIFPRASVYSFEPDPRAIASFKAKIQNPRSRLFELAIGVQDGDATFHMSGGQHPNYPRSEGWDASGSLRRPKHHLSAYAWCTFDTTMRVPVRRLDTWTREQNIDRIDFIWADVQGAECDLIEGGRESLSRTRFFYTEYSNSELYEGEWTLAQIVAALPDFEIVKRYHSDVMLRNTKI